MSQQPDELSLEDTVVARAVAGDRDALTELLRCHGPQLQERLRRDIGARWQPLLDADDVLQVTFLECFLRIGTFKDRGHGSFAAWLSRIGHHNLLDAFRSLDRAAQCVRERPRSFATEVESSLALFDFLAVTSGTPSRNASAEETHVRVRQAVADLPRDYSQVLTLYDLEARSIDEVAAAMGRTAGAVYMLRARALDYLRETLGSESRI